MSGSHIVVVLTNTKGDVERHRVCDKHIIKVAEQLPAVTVVKLSTRGLMSIVVVVPSDQPLIYGRMTLRWPPIYHPVVVGSFNVTVALLTTQWSEWLAVSRISESTLWQRCHATNSLNPLRCTLPRWWPISQLRRLLPWRMTLCIRKVRRQGKVCRVKLPTSMLSWLRTTVAGECYGDYRSNTQTKLICITIAQPHPYPPAIMMHVNPTNT